MSLLHCSVGSIDSTELFRNTSLDLSFLLDRSLLSIQLDEDNEQDCNGAQSVKSTESSSPSSSSSSSSSTAHDDENNTNNIDTDFDDLISWLGNDDDVNRQTINCFGRTLNEIVHPRSSEEYHGEVTSTKPLVGSNKRKPKKRSVGSTTSKIYVTPQKNDVLFGRGAYTNHFDGNKAYRRLIMDRQVTYQSYQSIHDKIAMKHDVIELVQKRYHGRFLKRESSSSSSSSKSRDGTTTTTTSKWYVASTKEVQAKVAQALRENWKGRPNIL